MRKDYTAISPTTSDVTEIDRVEQHWTTIWQKMQADPVVLATKIAQREEYRLMKPYLEKLPLPRRLLDGGCGLGEWTIYLQNQGSEVYGIDISRDTINWLTQRFPDYYFACADIRALDFPDNFFNAYFSWGVFEHFEEGLGSCVNEAWRILQPDGFLFISVPFQNWRHIWRDSRSLSRWGIGYQPDKGFAEPMRFYQWRLTIPELEQELALRGFRVLQIHPIALESGLQRALHHDFHLRQGSRGNVALQRLLRWVTPRRWVCHMLMAIAQKSQLPKTRE